MWTQLAMALVFQLGIDKGGSRFVDPPASEGSILPSRALPGPERSMEERRAILGVFIISSMQVPSLAKPEQSTDSHWFRVWTRLRQMEALRWTPYMDDCIRTLRDEGETALDTFLIVQAKSCVIVDHITHPPTEWTLDGEGSRPPPPYFPKALQLQLQDMQQSLPAELQTESQ